MKTPSWSDELAVVDKRSNEDEDEEHDGCGDGGGDDDGLDIGGKEHERLARSVVVRVNDNAPEIHLSEVVEIGHDDRMCALVECFGSPDDGR